MGSNQIDQHLAAAASELEKLGGIKVIATDVGEADYQWELDQDRPCYDPPMEFRLSFVADGDRPAWRSLELIAWAAWEAGCTIAMDNAAHLPFHGSVVLHVFGDPMADAGELAEMLMFARCQLKNVPNSAIRGILESAAVDSGRPEKAPEKRAQAPCGSTAPR